MQVGVASGVVSESSTIVTVCPSTWLCTDSEQLPEIFMGFKILSEFKKLLLPGDVISIDGSVLFTVNVELSTFAANAFPAASVQIELAAEMETVPFPVQPLTVTVREVRLDPETVAVQSVVSDPPKEIPLARVELLRVPRLVSSNERV